MATTISSGITGTVSSLGTGSGLDLQTLLTKLVSAEKTPQQNVIDQNTQLVNGTISAIGAVKSKLSALQSVIAKLKDSTTFGNRTATSSNTSLFTTSADSTADTGSYSIGVLNLAAANKVASGNFASADTTVGSGTLTISVGSNSFNVDISAAVNDSLSGIRDAINNASDNKGVRASILTVSNGSGGTVSKLVLTATSTGASSQIGVSVADSDGTNTDAAGLSQLYYLKSDTVNSKLSEVNAAQDAKITIDGFAATSSTNVFTNAIAGVTITAVKGSTDPLNPDTANLTVGADSSTTQGGVQQFVSAYNDLINTIQSLAGYNNTTNTAGPLQGDTSLNGIKSSLQRIISDTVIGAPADLSSLAFIGVKTNADGTLALDSTKLSNAVTNRYADLKTLFSGTSGVFGKIDSQLTTLLGSGGVLSSRETALQDQLRDLSNQQASLDQRITDFQSRYQKQFSALDALVTQLNSTGSFLTQQLTATAQIISRKSSS